MIDREFDLLDISRKLQIPVMVYLQGAIKGAQLLWGFLDGMMAMQPSVVYTAR